MLHADHRNLYAVIDCNGHKKMDNEPSFNKLQTSIPPLHKHTHVKCNALSLRSLIIYVEITICGPIGKSFTQISPKPSSVHHLLKINAWDHKNMENLTDAHGNSTQ